MQTIRGPLNVPAFTVNDHEAGILFRAIDLDAGGDIDLEELCEFLQRGKKTPEEEAKKAAEKIQRTWNYLKMAFDKLVQKYPTEQDIRKLFQRFDKDGEGKLSHYEFEIFVRSELKLSSSVLSPPDLTTFYKKLDLDGDGLEIEEFLFHIKENKKIEKRSSPLYVPPSNALPHLRKPTYRKILEKKYRMNPLNGTYRMNISESSPSLPQLTPFVGLGRERPPVFRLHASSATALGPGLPPI
jgi:Ca2+-binding EF-hand superfamily protein